MDTTGKTITVTLSISEQRSICELICQEIDFAKVDQEEEARMMDNERVAVIQAYIDSLKTLLKKLEI